MSSSNVLGYVGSQDFNLEFLPKVRRPLFGSRCCREKKKRFPRNASKRRNPPPWLRAEPSKLSRYFGRCSVLQRDRARDPNSAREEDACNERQPLLRPSVSPLNCRGWSKAESKSRWLHGTRGAGEFFRVIVFWDWKKSLFGRREELVWCYTVGLGNWIRREVAEEDDNVEG